MIIDNQREKERLIGVISDTHGLVRQEAIDVLRGVEMILHAGDVGNPQVLEVLHCIAPVIAVRGNIDRGKWAENLPEREVVEIGSISIYMLHNLKGIDLNPTDSGFQVVISGHSHKPSVEEREDILYINPGSAGPRRFSLPVSIAHLTITGEAVGAQIIALSV